MRKILFLLLLIPFACYGQPMKVIGRSPFYVAPVVVAYCEQYQTVYDALTVKPGADTAVFQNTMVKALVDGGYWARMDLFYVMAQRYVGDAKINWMNPGTFDLTDPGTTNPTFTIYEGFTGDGSSDYFSTTYVPATHASKISQNSTTVAGYSRTNANGDYALLGVEGGNNIIKLRPRVGGNLSSYINSTGVITAANATSAGLSISTRRGAEEIEAYMNGSSLGADTDVSAGLPADDFLAVLACNDDTVLESFSLLQTSIILVMNAVSDAEALAINTIIETYMDAIGKGVQ